MKRAGLSSILIAVTLFTVVVIAEAQQPKKVPRIGYLSANDPSNESARAEAIRLALRAISTCFLQCDDVHDPDQNVIRAAYDDCTE